MAGEANNYQRSEEIRRRRTTRSRPKSVLKGRQKLAGAPRSAPPVLSRNPMVNLGQERRNARRTRRRYDVALDSQGTEMRLPALPRLHLGWRVASVSLFAFLVFVLYQFWNSPMYRIDAPEIEGLKNLTRSEINAVLGVTGKQVFMLDPDYMQQELVEAFPEISSVSVAVSMPQTVVISVTERIPVLIWRQGEHTKMVDLEGKTFPMRDGIAEGEYPVVEASGDPPLMQAQEAPSDTQLTLPGLETLMKELALETPANGGAEQFLAPEMVRAILTMAKQAPKGYILVYDPAHGLGWKDRRGWVAYFGNVNAMQMKLRLYRTIAKQLKAMKIQPVVISVEYVHAPYYRLEP